MDHIFDTPDPVELYVEIGKGRIDVTATPLGMIPPSVATTCIGMPLLRRKLYEREIELLRTRKR